jgi:hypothetical protein
VYFCEQSNVDDSILSKTLFCQKKEFTGFKVMGGGTSSIHQNLTLTHA